MALPLQGTLSDSRNILSPCAISTSQLGTVPHEKNRDFCDCDKGFVSEIGIHPSHHWQLKEVFPTKVNPELRRSGTCLINSNPNLPPLKCRGNSVIHSDRLHLKTRLKIQRCSAHPVHSVALQKFSWLLKHTSARSTNVLNGVAVTFWYYTIPFPRF